MHSPDPLETPVPLENLFAAADVISLLREHRWLVAEPTPEQIAWAERAAAYLGHYAVDRVALGELLRLIFEYDAVQILQRTEAHALLARNAAREVVRHLALLLLEPAPLTNERFKEIVAHLKEKVGLRSRDLFHPIRLALAGQLGEGELDRVVLLLEEAAGLPFAVLVKSPRARILEFCAALD